MTVINYRYPTAREYWDAHKMHDATDVARLDYAQRHFPGKEERPGMRPIPRWKEADADPKYAALSAQHNVARKRMYAVRDRIPNAPIIWSHDKFDMWKPTYDAHVIKAREMKEYDRAMAKHAPDFKSVKHDHSELPLVQPHELKVGDIAYGNTHAHHGFFKVTRTTHGGKRVLAVPHPEGGAETRLSAGSGGGYPIAGTGYKKLSPERFAQTHMLMALHKHIAARYFSPANYKERFGEEHPSMKHECGD